MIIAGAGGHGKEVFAVALRLGIPAAQILFYDQDPSKISKAKLISDLSELKPELKKDPRFVIGVGNPEYREHLYKLFMGLGGQLFPISSGENYSFHQDLMADLMPLAFLGPDTKIGKAVLINTRAQVHHECEVGDFTEIGPGAMLLGGAKVGKKCRIGAGAVLLPGVELGDEVIVGAGAVVTKSFGDSVKIMGIPARENPA
ncbi:acetyltransferase [Algoriphagus sp. CAU 1675]|uniref:acetyltransferase n=1 Tax=Algoriphagus sp. CAU 1675 TaxID=3032597 RepID=UPI0023DA5F2B|nr:acetyltransferase [Algoriphagus sp. CAU 1675]MDF2159425.1 acetyltransferase [Algoriphagus sp. CAU 1675]